MTNVLDVFKNLDAFEKKIHIITERIVFKKENSLTNLNTKDQLFDQGIDSNGKKLKKYTLFTRSIKKFKNQPYDRTTLKDTGQFHRSFRSKYKPFKLFFSATDEKTDELKDKYGEDIFGLTQENEQIANYEIILPELQHEFKNETGL